VDGLITSVLIYLIVIKIKRFQKLKHSPPPLSLFREVLLRLFSPGKVDDF